MTMMIIIDDKSIIQISKKKKRNHTSVAEMVLKADTVVDWEEVKLAEALVVNWKSTFEDNADQNDTESCEKENER